VAFLGLKELATKFGFGNFDIKVFRMAPKAGGKSNNFSINTDDEWKLELPSLLDGTHLHLLNLEKLLCMLMTLRFSVQAPRKTSPAIY